MLMNKMTLAAAALIGSAVSAQAVTVSSAAGQDLTRNVTQANELQIFTEATGVTVGAGDVTVDYLVGTNLNAGDTASGVDLFASGQALTAGTYDSFLVHYDPTGRDALTATFDFGATIVAIILSNGSSQTLLEASDAIFGTAAAYDDSIGRRTESGDSFTLVNGTTLSFDLGTNANHVDNIRVLTQADVAPVPVPAAGLMLLTALGGAAALRRRG